jgi:hypothetical protein
LNASGVENYAGKVTGMILEGQTVDYIVYLTQNKVEFSKIVEEALRMLEDYERQQMRV